MNHHLLICKAKHLLPIFGLFLLVLLVSVKSGAQDLTTQSKKAAKHYEKAIEYYDQKKTTEAEEELKNALVRDSLFIEAHILLAALYTDLRKIDRAIASYRKSVQINPDFFPPNLFNLGALELGKGLYEEAKGHFTAFLRYKGLNPKFTKLAQHNIKVCVFAVEEIKNPVPFEPINLGANVNTSYDEYYPGITADDAMLLYTRRIKDNANYFGEQEDFFVSVRKGGEWGKNYNIGAPINTHYNEGSPTISPDGQIIIFAACEELDGYGPGRKGLGSCDIFFVKNLGEKWSSPINMGPPISSNAWDAQPSYASDGTTLYFVSNRKGGLGDADIWVSQLTKEGVWGQPENLGPKINTSGREEAVFIHQDNQTLYFTSDGQIGMGGLDIYVTKKDANGNWGDPVNLGYPINTFNDENGLIVGASGEIAFFSSNREGGYGGLDLYMFELHKAVRPIRVTYMKGKVYDSSNRKPLGSKFELVDLESEKLIVESYSNRSTGEFLVCLPVNKNYALNVSKKGYVFYSENFSLKEVKDQSEPFLIDVPLQKIKKGSNVVLKNVFFETDSYELKKESKVELNKVINFMNENTNVYIEIGGHTDDVGDENYNKKLSNDRAKSVIDYLVEKGISSDRLKYKGYGESEPIATNLEEWGRAKNRRTEFKIVDVVGD